MSSLSSGKLEDIKYLYENVVSNNQEVLSEDAALDAARARQDRQNRQLGAQLGDIAGAGLQGFYLGQETKSTNPVARFANAATKVPVDFLLRDPLRNLGNIGAGMVGIPPSAGGPPSPKDAGIRGTSTGGRPPRTGTPAKTTPSAPGAAPTAPGRSPAAPRPSAPAVPVLSKQGGVEGTGVGANFKPGAWSAAEKSRYAAQAAKTSPGANSAMNQWARANPNLAAAAAERARTRGTQQTDNPLMRDMRSRLPANTPSVQSPAVSQLGAGNQSLSKNPNAFRAAPATPTAPIRPVTPTAAINAASSTSPAASGSVVPATNRLAAATRPTPMIPTRMPLRQSYEYEYENVYDVILEYLIDEGYAETVEHAEVIMVNMSEGWRESIVEAKNWIKGAIKHPGKLHRDLGVPQDENIPTKKLNAAAKKPGKLGKEARLAKTLKSFH